jgi:hypothetical protein
VPVRHSNDLIASGAGHLRNEAGAIAIAPSLSDQREVARGPPLNRGAFVGHDFTLSKTRRFTGAPN